MDFMVHTGKYSKECRRARLDIDQRVRDAVAMQMEE